MKQSLEFRNNKETYDLFKEPYISTNLIAMDWTFISYGEGTDTIQNPEKLTWQ